LRHTGAFVLRFLLNSLEIRLQRRRVASVDAADCPSAAN